MVAAGEVIVLAPDERHGFCDCRTLTVHAIPFTADLLARSEPRLKAVPGLADPLFTEPLFRREGGQRPRLRLDPTALAGCITTLAAAQDTAVAAALAFMEEKIDDDALHVADIAAAAGLSPHWFSTVFARYTGVSPWQWLTTVRQERAKRLLRDTSTSVTHIALDVGLHNPRYFACVFRAQTGAAPRAWRDRGKSGSSSRRKRPILPAWRVHHAGLPCHPVGTDYAAA